MCSEYLLAPSLLLFRTPCQAAQAPPPPRPPPRPTPVQIGLRILVLEFWRHLEATGFPFPPQSIVFPQTSPQPLPHPTPAASPPCPGAKISSKQSSCLHMVWRDLLGITTETQHF